MPETVTADVCPPPPTITPSSRADAHPRTPSADAILSSPVSPCRPRLYDRLGLFRRRQILSPGTSHLLVRHSPPQLSSRRPPARRHVGIYPSARHLSAIVCRTANRKAPATQVIPRTSLMTHLVRFAAGQRQRCDPPIFTRRGRERRSTEMTPAEARHQAPFREQQAVVQPSICVPSFGG
jgi:hypothetical protein